MVNLKAKSFQLRKSIVEMVYRAKTGHIGGDLSVCDILTVLYCKQMNITPQTVNDPQRDRFIMSKGHSVEALYSVLADCGFFPQEELQTFSQFGSKYIGHPNNKINGIEMNSGSLGHGLPVAVGMAMAARMDGAGYRVYVVMGDGELAEGSVWEGFMSAGHYKLGNLVAIIDRNYLQISGSTEDVMTHQNLAAQVASFGWNVLETDGNDVQALERALDSAKACTDRPSCIIANTTKGCGVSFMENQVGWHHRVPTEAEYRQAMQELDAKQKAAQGEGQA